MSDDELIETPQDRRNRRHEEDKKINPDRHHLKKEFYSYVESLEICVWCAPDFKEKYSYDTQTNRYIKVYEH